MEKGRLAPSPRLARTSPSRAPRHRGPLATASPSPGPASPSPFSPLPGLRPPLCPPGAGERHKAGAPPAAVPRPQTKARGGAASPRPGPAPWGGGGGGPAAPVNQPCWGTHGGAPSSPTPGGAARRCPATPPRGAGRGRRPARGSRSDLCRVPQPRRHPARTAQAPRSPLLQRRHLASFCSLASAAGPPHQYARGALTSVPAPRTAPRARHGSPRPPRARGAGAPPAPSPAPSPLPTARGFCPGC